MAIPYGFRALNVFASIRMGMTNTGFASRCARLLLLEEDP